MFLLRFFSTIPFLEKTVEQTEAAAEPLCSTLHPTFFSIFIHPQATPTPHPTVLFYLQMMLSIISKVFSPSDRSKVKGQTPHHILMQMKCTVENGDDAQSRAAVGG